MKINQWALSPSSQEVWVLKVNHKRGEALVRYTDGTEQWLSTALMRVEDATGDDAQRGERS